ncbi:LOW QUALITY PROTEIN: hypothetical protein V2J09_006478 [Rumex salicifolius]
MDRLVQSFIWGDHDGHRKIQLELCAPKDTGILGLRSAKEMNLTILGKLAWSLFNNSVGHWGGLNNAKYGIKFNEGKITCSTKCMFSPTWRTIVLNSEALIPGGTKWNIGNDYSMHFWEDRLT